MSNVDDNFSRRRLEELQAEWQRALGGGGEPPYIPPVSLLERLARAEEAIGGLRHSLNHTVALGAIIVAIIVGAGIYIADRVDKVDDRLLAQTNSIKDQLNGVTTQISMQAAETRKDLIGIATAISNSITAARQPTPPTPPSR